MYELFQAFKDSFLGSLNWTWNSIIFQVPWYQNYFWGLIIISLVVWGMEIAFPWRKKQGIIRKDFWLDGFYMFFNFFLFAIFISGFYRIMQLGFESIGIQMDSLSLINTKTWPTWASPLSPSLL